jgi:hypothetical protein
MIGKTFLRKRCCHSTMEARKTCMQLISAQPASNAQHTSGPPVPSLPGEPPRSRWNNLRFLRGKFLTLCLCKIFELLFRHGVNHLF